MKIVKGQFAPISTSYSQDLHKLISLLLLKDYKKRPSIAEIFDMSSMKEKMKLYGYTENDHLLSQTVADFPIEGKNLLQNKPVNVEKLREELKDKNSKI